MIIWQPGMDHAYLDGVLWLKSGVPVHAAVAVSVSSDAQHIAVQIAVTNYSIGGMDILPDQVSMTLSQPQALPLGYIPPERAPQAGVLRASTVKPGQELRGTVFFKQERMCAGRSACSAMLTVPIGEMIFVFPVILENRNPSAQSRSAAPIPASSKPPQPQGSAASPTPTQTPGPAMQVAGASTTQVAHSGNRRDWKTGRVLDYAQSRRVYTTGATTSAETTGTITPGWGGATVNADTTATTTVNRVAVKTTNLFVVGDQYIYEVQDSTQHGNVGWLGIAAQAIANRKHGCRFIVGEEITYAQDKRYLYLIDPDGKECKAEILRQEKLKETSR